MSNNMNIMLLKVQKEVYPGCNGHTVLFEDHKHTGRRGGEDITHDLPRVGSYSQMNRLVRNLTTIAVEEKEQHVRREVLLESLSSENAGSWSKAGCLLADPAGKQTPCNIVFESPLPSKESSNCV